MAKPKIEKLVEHEGVEGLKSQDEKRIKERGEIQKEATNVVGSFEAQKDQEGANELSEGKISESLSEDKKKGSFGGKSKALTADEIESIRAKLLANLPTQEVMVSQIRKRLFTKEKQLQKDYKKLKKMGHKAAFQLTKIVASMRKLQEYFLMLAHATFDVVKQLWLKIVHGV